ncbi:hypothetical protein GALMADRAFT_155817 [Galerina marginata CBS 339.88]|uniref:Uncharacterized protein n=1 Tax=Galerina marginata (strain CBS 339.88) TaxID=685588 RepID=A0A067T1U3_GALM3|nr:hypothetical protein GALMADRAFT_155817 [Galerina marginata CBS 339.88]
MLLILGIGYLFHKTIQAAPVSESSLLDNNPPNLSFLSQCLCPGPQRSVWDILWSCLATIFACTWLSVHPNIPPPGETWWKIGLRRLELMFWALIAPELIILWAMRQWQGARILAGNYHEHQWTKTHGYFIQMGGFILLKNGEIDFPKITEEEIRDRSKGDGLSKALVILQTSWFIAQCVARRTQGLTITELELITAAYAVLNGIMYFLWWNKPLDVRCPVPVHLLITVNDPFKFGSSGKHRTSLRKELLSFVSAGYRGSTSNLTSSVTWIWKSMTELSLKTFQKAAATIIIFPWIIISSLFSRLNDIYAPDSMREDAESVSRIGIPTFHASTADHSGVTRLLILALTSSIAALFGGIHCVGWFFTFPSHTELMLWRVCSAVITIIPLITWFAFTNAFLFEVAVSKPVKMFLGTIAIVGSTLLGITVPCIPAYVIARLLLLTEAFTALRYLPPPAREVVNWMSFIPHI